MMKGKGRMSMGRVSLLYMNKFHAAMPSVQALLAKLVRLRCVGCYVQRIAALAATQQREASRHIVQRLPNIILQYRSDSADQNFKRSWECVQTVPKISCHDIHKRSGRIFQYKQSAPSFKLKYIRPGALNTSIHRRNEHIERTK